MCQRWSPGSLGVKKPMAECEGGALPRNRRNGHAAAASLSPTNSKKFLSPLLFGLSLDPNPLLTIRRKPGTQTHHNNSTTHRPTVFKNIQQFYLYKQLDVSSQSWVENFMFFVLLRPVNVNAHTVIACTYTFRNGRWECIKITKYTYNSLSFYYLDWATGSKFRLIKTDSHHMHANYWRRDYIYKHRDKRVQFFIWGKLVWNK